MAEFTNSNIVTVAAGQNLPLTETAVKCGSCITHREGAGIVTLRGLQTSAGRAIRSASGLTSPYLTVELWRLFLLPWQSPENH